jgi:endonuclease/exonuclease/phosphatase family metal-dependent hydrolase
LVIRHSRRTALLVVLAASGIVVWHGSNRVPTGAASGYSLESPVGHALRMAQGGPPAAAFSRDTLRVATFNIHGGRGADRVRDLDRIADLLRDFDVVGLNEVHGARLPSSDNQAASLGKTLNQPWLFAPTERRWWRDDFGNGVISSLPVCQWYRLPLPATQGAGFRNVVWLTIPWRSHTVNVLVTHLDRQRDREMQLRTIFALFQSLAQPAILVGDFNTPATDPALNDFLARSDATDVVGAAECHVAANNRIDWILARGLTRINSGCVPTEASDHPLVWTELRLDVDPKTDEKNSNQ